MADIVAGVGTTHGPLLFFPPDKWDLRADFDRAQTDLAFRDGSYTFAELCRHRQGDRAYFDSQNTLEVRTDRFNKCQQGLDVLGEYLRGVDADVHVIIGDDQHEWFHGEAQPTFSVYCGDSVLNTAVTPAELAVEPGKADRQKAYRPPSDKTYPIDTDLAQHIVGQAMTDEFDVSVTMEQPRDKDGSLHTVGHAYGFVYRRFLNDAPKVMVPILINTFYPPNQPTPKRCFEFGQSIGRAIRSWKSDKKVAVVASGGMSHFVIDEEWDRRIIDLFLKGDYETLKAEPNIVFRSGTSEVKNWITAAGILSDTDLQMSLVDYVPCYRSEAGTGSGMAFATWQ